MTTIKKAQEAATKAAKSLEQIKDVLAPPSYTHPFLDENKGFVNPLAHIKPVSEYFTDGYASEFYKRLCVWINKFDKQLDNKYEVGVRLVNFGQAITFHLEDIGYSDPYLICFRGRTNSDDPVELVQHISQISILLMKLPRKHPDKPKKPFGFASRSKKED